MRTAGPFGPEGGPSVLERVRGGLMDRSLIETLRAEQNCRKLVHLVNAAGYLNHFDWGGTGGVH